MKKNKVNRNQKLIKKRKKPIKKMKLLSGGNPQIAKELGNKPVKAYISAMPGWKHSAGKKIDFLVTKYVPEVQKAVKWNSPFYGRKGEGWFLSFHCYTKYIKVTFFKGSELNPKPPGESKHKDVRYLDIYEDDKIETKEFVDWIQQASKISGWMAS